MKCIQVIVILFMDFCSCASLRNLLCIEVILGLFLNVCFSCFSVSWIIHIEFVI